MITLVDEELSMIADAAERLFADLAAADRKRRQLESQRIGYAVVRDALDQLGLFGDVADTAPMTRAAVQVRIALEAGAASLPFPVLETLAAHAVIRKPGIWIASSASVERDVAVLPELRADGLHGMAALVPFARLADTLLVVARRANATVLTQVRQNVRGMTLRDRTSVEPDYPVQDVVFDGSPAELLPDTAAQALNRRSVLLASAEIAGACRQMVAMAREHLLTRTQFGQPLGANQALKHALADAHVRVEALTTSLLYAAAADDAQADDATAAILAAKVFAGRAGRLVADSMFQLHGAIGYTMEYPLHLLIRRVHRLGVSHGSTTAQADRLFNLFEATCPN